jgi:hypothetical protein
LGKLLNTLSTLFYRENMSGENVFLGASEGERTGLADRVNGIELSNAFPGDRPLPATEVGGDDAERSEGGDR